MLGLILGCTALIEYGGEAGRILGYVLAGVMSVCVFLAFHRLGQIKQDNAVQTYREVLAFMEGESLDDIEHTREQKRRGTQHKLLLATAVLAGTELVFALVTVVIAVL